jgi:hypothetical protein
MDNPVTYKQPDLYEKSIVCRLQDAIITLVQESSDTNPYYLRVVFDQEVRQTNNKLLPISTVMALVLALVLVLALLLVLLSLSSRNITTRVSSLPTVRKP